MSWEVTIKPQNSLLSLGLKEIFRYKDLLLLLIRRDLVAQYKQTILGPLWYVIQPALTTAAYLFVFDKVAGLSTDGAPGILFYLSGIIMWGLFSDCLTRTATTFRDNKGLFSKVYFPRMIPGISLVCVNLVKFLIQFVLLLLILAYFVFIKGVSIPLNSSIFLLPLLLITVMGLGLGLGFMISALTTKYRDLVLLMKFGVQLFMYVSPVIYPLSSIPEEKRWLFALNPMASILETFKHGILGSGVFNWSYLSYSFAFMVFTLFLGFLIFHRTEKNFLDTV